MIYSGWFPNRSKEKGSNQRITRKERNQNIRYKYFVKSSSSFEEIKRCIGPRIETGKKLIL